MQLTNAKHVQGTRITTSTISTTAAATTAATTTLYIYIT